MKVRTNIFRFVACAYLLSLALARSQEATPIDVSGVTDETRIGPARLCGNQSVGEYGSFRRVPLHLQIPDKLTYSDGEKLTFELTVGNPGVTPLRLPSKACSEKSPHSPTSPELEACIHLNFTTPAGENRSFRGPCLCASENGADVVELKGGDSIAIRGNAEIALVEANLFTDVYNGARPTLVLTPDISFYSAHFPPDGVSRAIGCVKVLPLRAEAENNVSVQIVGASRDKKHSQSNAR